MKRLILLATLAVAMFGATISNAQTRPYDRNRANERVQQTERRDEHRRFERRGWDRRDYGTYQVREYRYVRFHREVYKELYVTTYTRDGRVVERQLISRERVRDNRRSRFNIFLRF